MDALLRAIAEREERQERAAILRAGLVAAAVYNVHRKKGRPPIRPEDFLPRKRESRELAPTEFASVLRGWAAGHNAQVRRAARTT